MFLEDAPPSKRPKLLTKKVAKEKAATKKVATKKVATKKAVTKKVAKKKGPFVHALSCPRPLLHCPHALNWERG